MTERQKRLGSAEKAALLALVDLGGVWGPDTRWLWESHHWTVTIYESLVRKGLAHEKVAGESFEITPEGRSVAATLSIPQRPSVPVNLNAIRTMAPGQHRKRRRTARY